MSKPEEQLVQELSCPICLQLFSDPVVLPCGHNYCQACICKTVAMTDECGKTLPRCPECREEYEGIGSLQRNFKLCNIIEGYQAAIPNLEKQHDTHSPAVQVVCEYCIDQPVLAVKSCLKCEVSLCSRHLQKHHEKESFRTHSVVEPLKELGMKSCTVHQQPLEYFCSNDMTSLCSTCFLQGYHQNHDVLTFSVAEEEMRRALASRNKLVSCRLQMAEILLQKTAEEQGASEAIGDKLINKAVTLMDSMAAVMDRYRERLRMLLEEERGQRRKSWQQGVIALEEQQQQLLDAQQRATEALSETDTCVFIHRFLLIEDQLRKVVEITLPSAIPSKAPLNTRRLQTGLKTQDFRSEMIRFMDSLHIILNPLELTFNIYTAHPSLIVSNDLRTVKYSSSKQTYPDHTERFTSAPQVLCSQGFSSGEHVWVVEVGANSMWSLGVCYKSIPRRGDHSRLGHNSVSWRLQWKNGKLTVCQSSSNVALGEITTHPLRIEVALDYEGGTLSFHSTKGRRDHLHTFRAVFREPVYPAFSIHSNTTESWITLHSGM
nr:PREDICTED: E3 ubiquitin-protein ligase Midline-1-like [Paralichthys olivaceus]XP_019944252.1 PREDICTED: E3 ubiquitin-protein ligase Midline-1-like [Paralichthys olivaceus]XP_019944253.1 PREDICTED: E3 ubiquitin-protein ligase Midline-1-like [Paralichthys olivaceus]XP_019944254.1 PREDICTED: E3 ubiquitin-protein ligase Midline-1-like [Paralichthys olivaceus]